MEPWHIDTHLLCKGIPMNICRQDLDGFQKSLHPYAKVAPALEGLRTKLMADCLA